VLEYAVERFHPRLVVACSFQKEASVVLDLILRAAPDARVFTLDTHSLHTTPSRTSASTTSRSVR
jgi:3'-phosphoadenosine 5'-phosphosulfate sulfotransferase (PAPS reductase)/FAD synthetase